VLGFLGVLSDNFENPWRAVKCLTNVPNFVFPVELVTNILTNLMLMESFDRECGTEMAAHLTSLLPEEFICLSSHLVLDYLAALESHGLTDCYSSVMRRVKEVTIALQAPAVLESPRQNSCSSSSVSTKSVDNNREPVPDSKKRFIETYLARKRLRAFKSFLLFKEQVQKSLPLEPQPSAAPVVVVHELEKAEAAIQRAINAENYESVVRVIRDCSTKPIAMEITTKLYKIVADCGTYSCFKDILLKFYNGKYGVH
jgi:hypothetical protein